MLKTTTTFLSSLLALSVLLLSTHAKDVSALSTATPHGKKVDDSSIGHKVQKIADKQAGELHNHVEKQTYKSMVKAFSDQSPQADNRSLRKQRHSAPERKLRFRPWLAFAGA